MRSSGMRVLILVSLAFGVFLGRKSILTRLSSDR